MALVAKRYAEALADLAFEKGNADGYKTQLADIIESFKEVADFKNFLINPEIKASAKKDTINKLYSGHLDAELINFLNLLVDKGRIGILDSIFYSFIETVNSRQKVLNIKIITVSPLTASQIEEITEKFRKLNEADIAKPEIVIDASLIGGIKVVIGDKVYDGSVKGRLDLLKQQIIKS